MALTILSVAYPLAPVGPAAVGGAEQVLGQLDRALTAAGQRSLVAAPAGSLVAGELVALPPVPDRLDAAAKAAAQRAAAAAIAAVRTRERVDLIHLHGIDFMAYLPAPGAPVLATLHLPPDWYPPELFALERPDTVLACVSDSQRRACPPARLPVTTIANGVALAPPAPVRRRGHAAMLARICPEKGVHLALQAAALAAVPLLIGGQAFGYDEHRAYLAEQVQPRLSPCRRLLGPLGPGAKRRLLSSARCLLVPSLAQETSSLVAMEALACGTPVIAFPNGALAEIVEPGVTGFLVEDVAGMAEAIGQAHRLSPDACRAAARRRFSAERCSAEYLDLYRRMAA